MQTSSSESTRAWAARLTAGATLPDQRLNERLATTLETLAAKPLDSIPQACGSWSQTKAVYRTLENERARAGRLTASICDDTAKQAARLPVLYVVQHTCSLNYSSLTRTVGLGPINDSETARGLHVHTTVAVGRDGVVLGMLDQQCWARDPEEKTSERRKERPIEQKF